MRFRLRGCHHRGCPKILRDPIATIGCEESPMSAIDPPRPDWVISALGRAGYGPRPEDVAAVIQQGFSAWVEMQLAPRESDDQVVRQRLANLKLRIHYPAN